MALFLLPGCRDACAPGSAPSGLAATARPECDAQHPCGPWFVCRAATCLTDPRAPEPPAITSVELLPREPGRPAGARVKGTAEAGTQVRVFRFAECQSNAIGGEAFLAAERFASEGSVVELYTDPGAYQLSAMAYSPPPRLTISPCSAAWPLLVAPVLRDDWWKGTYASAEEATSWFRGLRDAQQKLSDSLPAPVRRAIEGATDFLPIGALNTSDHPQGLEDAAPASGDFNCDGKADFALVGTSKASALARALTEPADPPLGALELVYQEFHDVRLNRPAMVMVALSRADGSFGLQRLPGSHASALGTKALANLALGLAPDQPSAESDGCAALDPSLDLPWATAHACQVLAVGCCERGESQYVWSPRSQKLVGWSCNRE